MKQISFIIILLLTISGIYAQKPAIDSSVYNKWASVGHAKISNDGKFALYTIGNQPVGNSTLVLISTDKKWKKEFVGLSSGEFTPDSKSVVLIRQDNKLVLISLGESSVEEVGEAESFKMLEKDNGYWLSYLDAKNKGRLVLLDKATNQRNTYDSVTDYLFNESGTTLLLHFQKGDKQSLLWVNLKDLSTTIIWEGKRAENFVFDKNGNQLIFSVINEKNGKSDISFWYYKSDQNTAHLFLTNRSNGIDSSLQLADVSCFNSEGSVVFFNVVEREFAKPESDPVSVDIWNYKDSKLQSSQLHDLDPKRYFFACVIDELHVIRIYDKNEFSFDIKDGNNFQLIPHWDGDVDLGEQNWNPAANGTEYLMTVKDGKRIPISDLKGLLVNNFRVSPENKYVVYYDSRKKNYFSYDIGRKTTTNITQRITTNWTVDNDRPSDDYSTPGFCSWLKGDSDIILYDRYDLWKVDLAGRRRPVCVTNLYGRKNEIIFRLAINDRQTVLGSSDIVLLVALNQKTKDNGFFNVNMNLEADPNLLTMVPFMYEHPLNRDYGEMPIRAKNASSYLVKRMDASESPNYFSTTDFRIFNQLSEVYPERAYNWMKTELKTWQLPTGKTTQGILYKPEDFDSTKRYPLIFYYYERVSDRLHVYSAPEFSGGELNISWYVSNGYLVFTPDMHYTIGKPGESALNCIVSAANYLSKKPWVGKMGIQGISWGGCQTNYIVTHTNIFSAAVSASGIFDFVSEYGAIDQGGKSIQNMFEFSQFRMGGTLWQKPDLYLQNSPIFNAPKLTTPFLMMHTKNDGLCLFANAIEFFTALRRLNKPVWMLQYDNCNHGLWGKAAEDFTIRMQQYFDHFLKGKPAPVWMTKGVSARMKGIESGLEIENESPNVSRVN